MPNTTTGQQWSDSAPQRRYRHNLDTNRLGMWFPPTTVAFITIAPGVAGTLLVRADYDVQVVTGADWGIDVQSRLFARSILGTAYSDIRQASTTRGSQSISYAFTIPGGIAIIAGLEGICAAAKTGRWHNIYLRAELIQIAATLPGGGVATPLSLSVSPTSTTKTGAGASLTTDTVTVTPAGGTPGYSYVITWLSGGSGITVNSPTSASSTFGATGLAVGESRTGVALWTVRDSAAIPGVLTISVPVSISRDPAGGWSAALSVSPIYKYGAVTPLTTTTCTANVTNPHGTPTFLWTKISGDAIDIVTPNSAGTKFTASGLHNPETRVANFQCQVTDSPDSATLPVTVTIERSTL